MPPPCEPKHTNYKNVSHYNAHDCKTYTLYDTDAVCMPTWQQAKYVCEYYGQELAPWDDDASKSELLGAFRVAGQPQWDWYAPKCIYRYRCCQQRAGKQHGRLCWSVTPLFAFSTGSLLKLCAGNSFTCWVSGPSPADLCPLMSATGSIEKQGCEQNVRFVCRSKGEWLRSAIGDPGKAAFRAVSLR